MSLISAARAADAAAAATEKQIYDVIHRPLVNFTLVFSEALRRTEGNIQARQRAFQDCLERLATAEEDAKSLRQKNNSLSESHRTVTEQCEQFAKDREQYERRVAENEHKNKLLEKKASESDRRAQVAEAKARELAAGKNQQKIHMLASNGMLQKYQQEIQDLTKQLQMAKTGADAVPKLKEEIARLQGQQNPAKQMQPAASDTEVQFSGSLTGSKRSLEKNQDSDSCGSASKIRKTEFGAQSSPRNSGPDENTEPSDQKTRRNPEAKKAGENIRQQPVPAAPNETRVEISPPKAAVLPQVHVPAPRPKTVASRRNVKSKVELESCTKSESESSTNGNTGRKKKAKRENLAGRRGELKGEEDGSVERLAETDKKTDILETRREPRRAKPTEQKAAKSTSSSKAARKQSEPVASKNKSQSSVKNSRVVDKPNQDVSLAISESDTESVIVGLTQVDIARQPARSRSKDVAKTEKNTTKSKTAVVQNSDSESDQKQARIRPVKKSSRINNKTAK